LSGAVFMSLPIEGSPVGAGAYFRLARADMNLPGDFAPAQNDVESALLRLWDQVLDAHGLGANDDFFAAGGDSLAAVAVCAGIERDLDVVLPVSTLLSAGTPRLLAREIEAARARRERDSLTQIRSGRRPALAIVHGMHGDVFLTRKLAGLLSERRRVYGLRAKGLAEGEAPLGSVAAMAAHYLAALLHTEPNGPYLLGGYCGGTIVAYEMAQQLTRAGATVAGLVLLDPPISEEFAPWLHGRPPVPNKAPIIRPPAPLAGQRGDLRRRNVRAAMEISLAAYAPEPYAGRVLVVTSERRRSLLANPQTGWPRYAVGELTLTAVPGNHDDFFTDGLFAVGHALNEFVNRVAPVTAGAAA
jgi:acetoacetyl-CoA synthetase